MNEEEHTPKILHAFADYGAESEVLTIFGDVVRVGINPVDTNESVPIKADAHIESKEWDIPFSKDTVFDLGVFHPVCSKWAHTTSIYGDPESHKDMIPSAREIAEKYTDYYVIENVPNAPLRDPLVLEGRMFGLPIKYERAFETNFNVPQPPRHDRYWLDDGDGSKAETSSFFFSERSKTWWASVKGYRPDPYTKQHLAKNTIPAPYIHHILRAWLKRYEADVGISEGRVDYSNYDEEKETERREDANSDLSEYLN